jgi:hypothetical protein
MNHSPKSAPALDLNADAGAILEPAVIKGAQD